MAGFLGAGTLLFILLLGTSHSTPVKKGGSQNTVPQTLTGGGGYGPANPGQWGQGGFGSNPGMGFYHSDVPKAPSSSFKPGAGSGQGLYPGGPLMGNMGPVASQDHEWLQPPTRPLSDTEGSDGGTGGTGRMGDGGMGAGGMGSGGPGAGGSGRGGAGGPVGDDGAAGPLGLMYQPGELSHMANTFEHGNYDTETETQGVQTKPSGGLGPLGPLPMPLPGQGVGLGLGAGLGLGGDGAFGPHMHYHPGYSWYPHYDFLFLTGQYPPGTVSHFSSNFEQGKDYWHDAHYNKYFYTVGDDSGQQKKTFPGGQTPGNPKKQIGQA